MTEREGAPQGAEVNGAVDWRQYYEEHGLDPEATATGGYEVQRGPGAAAYRIRDREIAGVLAHQSGQGRLQDGLAAAREKFVNAPGQSHAMELYTRALLDAPIAFAISQRAREVRQSLAAVPRQRKRDEWDNLNERCRGLSSNLTEYKTVLRDMIVGSEGAINHDDMADMLVRTSNEDAWVRGSLMPEVTAKAAVFEYLSKMDQVDSVTLATAKEEFESGWHMTLRWKDGEEDHVAARPQGREPAGNVAYGVKGILEVGVPNASLSGFEILDEARDVLDKQLLGARDRRGDRSVHAYRTR